MEVLLNDSKLLNFLAKNATFSKDRSWYDNLSCVGRLRYPLGHSMTKKMVRTANIIYIITILRT